MSDRFFSLVLQKEPRHVDDAAVVERLRDLVAPIGLSVSLLKDGLDGGPAVLEIGGAKVSIVRQAQPVPDGTLERVARGSIGWPEAPAAVAVHTGHVIVGCLEEAQDHQQALHFATMTTLATAAVLQESDGLGVYWSTGEIMVSGQGWQQAAAAILAKSLPVADWINLIWRRGGEGEIGAATEGARAFFGMEIEFAPSRLQPAEIAGKLFNVVHYLLMNGAVLKDGDTLGQSAEEIIRVRFRERGAQFDGRVIELSLERGEPMPEPVSQPEQQSAPMAASAPEAAPTGAGPVSEAGDGTPPVAMPAVPLPDAGKPARPRRPVFGRRGLN
jgi:hypothetical protein